MSALVRVPTGYATPDGRYLVNRNGGQGGCGPPKRYWSIATSGGRVLVCTSNIQAAKVFLDELFEMEKEGAAQ